MSKALFIMLMVALSLAIFAAVYAIALLTFMAQRCPGGAP